MGFFVQGVLVEYPNAEAAIQAAKKFCKRDGWRRDVYGGGKALCTVTPDGHVDMTWEGGSVISTNAPKSKRISISEKRLI